MAYILKACGKDWVLEAAPHCPPLVFDDGTSRITQARQVKLTSAGDERPKAPSIDVSMLTHYIMLLVGNHAGMYVPLKGNETLTMDLAHLNLAVEYNPTDRVLKFTKIPLVAAWHAVITNRLRMHVTMVSHSSEEAKGTLLHGHEERISVVVTDYPVNCNAATASFLMMKALTSK